MRTASTLLFAVLLAGAPQAHAQPSAVDLTIAASADDGAALEEVVIELLAGLGVETRARRVTAIDAREVVDPPPDPPPAVARVWIGVEPPHATLYLADAPWERVLVRRVPIGEALDVASREQLAQIVHTAIEALMAGASIGLARAEARQELVPEEPEPEPAPTPQPASPAAAPPTARPLPATEPPPVTVEGWIGGALPLWADGPRVAGAVLARGAIAIGAGRLRPVLAVEASLTPSRRTETRLVRLDLHSIAIRLEAGVDATVDRDTAVQATAGLALDVTSVDPRAQAGGGVTASEARDEVSALLGARASVRRRLWRWLWAQAGLGVEVELVDTRYVVRDGANEITVLDPWSIRPVPFVALGGRW